MSAPMTTFLEDCDERRAQGWQRLKAGAFWSGLREHGIDRELYVALLTEIYHYTHHNAQNQALAAVRVGSDRLELLRFCLRHAFEEAGHDLMVLHDLEAVGVERATVLAARPLPETRALIAYLYEVSRSEDATARLGYSYWAESCYAEIRELIDALRSDLDLGERELTFFVAHEGIDRRHFEEVRAIAAESCTSQALRAGFLEVLETTLHLTGAMLDAVWRRVRAPELVPSRG